MHNKPGARVLSRLPKLTRMAATTPHVRRNTSMIFMHMARPTSCSSRPWRRKTQFRETFEGALSYFIGQDGTEDKGFAISGWTNVRWENIGIYTNDASAMAMGNYYFMGPDGSETKVEYTFGYVLIDGVLKINLHHSSLPYSPEWS